MKPPRAPRAPSAETETRPAKHATPFAFEIQTETPTPEALLDLNEEIDAILAQTQRELTALTGVRLVDLTLR